MNGRAAEYEVEVRRDCRIPTSDESVTLSADLYLPSGKPTESEKPFPTIVTMVPYRKDFSGLSYDKSLRWFAERGYACLLVDLTGSGSSDGTQRSKYDPQYANDAVAVVQWADTQDWCNGKIGMWGLSYVGLMSLRGATQHLPQLKAIIPIGTTTDPGSSVAHPDGARSDLYPVAWVGGSMLLLQLLPPLINHTSAEEQERWRRRLHEMEPWLLDEPRFPPTHPVWQERTIDASTIEIPVLCVVGWHDLAVAPSMVALYESLPGPKKLLVGPWGHVLPHTSSVAPIDFLSIAMRWWDRWLGDVENGVMDGTAATLYVRGAESGWHDVEAWPPKSNMLELRTYGSRILRGVVAAESQVEEAAEAIGFYDPDPTTGALSGLWGLPLGDLGQPLDQHDDDARSLSATSDEMDEDVVICGRPEVRMRILRGESERSGPIQRVVVRLTDIDPDGRSHFITTGIVTAVEEQGECSVVLRPTAYRLRAGHRVRVVISDSDFPRLTPLFAPSPFGVASVELSLPIASADALLPASLPPAEELPSLARAQAWTEDQWTITRDAISDAIEVVVGKAVKPAVRTGDGHLLEMEHDVRATVSRAVPAAATATGRHAAMLQMTTGERVEVETFVRCTQTSLWARGEVRVDGTTIFSRVWDSVLAYDHR